MSICAADSDATRCGGTCFDCTQPNTRTVACVSNTCSNTCVHDLPVACSATTNGQPFCGSWDFESTTTEGWFAGSDPNLAVLSLGTSSQAHSTGAQALAVAFQGNGTMNTARVRVKVCPNAVALNGRTVTADMALVTSTAPGSGSPGGGAGFFVFYDASGGQTMNGDFKAEQVSGGFSQIAGTAVSNMTDMEIVFQVPHAWVGTIFIDNVVIQ
jgi:hypothetical protein